MQVNKRNSTEEPRVSKKRSKKNAKIAVEDIEKATLHYGNKHENIDSALISQQAQSFDDETAQYTNQSGEDDQVQVESDVAAAAAAATAVAEAHEASEHENHKQKQLQEQDQIEQEQQQQQQEQQRPSQQILHQHVDKPLAGTEAWHRIRKDNHKEVERRRRENINIGIKELAALLPSPESNKSQVLQRAIEHIKRLKDNESNNVEKWTLEKLLNDQQVAELSASNEKLKAELERAYREVEHWKKIAEGRGSKADAQSH